MKERLGEETICMRIANLLQPGEVVNIGFGLVSTVSSYIPDEKDITFHTENGILGYGRVLAADDDPELMDILRVNAGSQFVAYKPGMVYVDYAGSAACVWSKRVETTVLGALQVSEKGDLASLSMDPKSGGAAWGGIGGAMDMAFGAGRTIVGMTHTDKKNNPKIVKRCSHSLTGVGCVKIIVTDLALIEVAREGLILKEIAPGWTVEEIQALTEPRLIVCEVKEMEL